LAGAAGTAQAVHVNDDGLGEVLIYPYYTVEGEQDTTFTIVNTTDRAKAVKVRLLEAMNSWEVIDFNLYLSPQDHWTGVITASDETDGAILVTPDTSCTVPAIPAEGAELRNLLFSDNGGANDNADGGPSEVSRTREGYIEIIEMGTLDDTAPGQFGAEAAVTHTSSGVPSDCSVVVGGWETVPANSIDPNDIVGEWGPGQGGNTANMVFEDAGGLYGYGTIVNVTEGTNATYDAVALDNFAATILHARPGDTAPNLGSGIPNADIIDGNTVVSAVFTESLDAVTALFMHDTLSNDYVLDSVISAGTDWVVTMPTKNEYVNLPTAADPFLSVWDNGAACEEVQFSQWNREEQTPGEDPIAGGVDFSPSPIPEDVVVTGFALCSEANVISFFGPDVEKDADGNPISGYSSALQPSGRVQYGFDVEFENGWARLDLGQDAASNPRTLTSDNAVTFSGLPVVGFAVQKFSNNTVGDGAFYAGVVSHKATRDISN
jgi:hypothetical protein